MTQRRLRIELDGDQRLIGRLLELGEHGRNISFGALEKALDVVVERAVDGINQGPKTGRVYRRGGRVHQASRMGEYPAADTGALSGSIHAEMDDALVASFKSGELEDGAGEIVGTVSSDLRYAAPLEYKPQGMGGRPFLRRALIESRDAVRRIFRDLRGRFRR